MKKFIFIILFMIPTYALASTGTQITEANKLYDRFYYKAAAALYEKVLEKNPSFKIYLKLSDTYFFDALVSPRTEKKQLLLKSKKAVIAAQEFKSNNAETLARLSRIYGQLALYAGGKEKIRLGKKVKNYAEQALAINPKQTTANAVLGIWNYELASLRGVERGFAKLFYGEVPKGSFEKSAQYLEKAIQYDPNVIFFHLSLAKTYLKLGKKSAAKDQLSKALSLPNSVASDQIYKKEAKKLLNKSP